MKVKKTHVTENTSSINPIREETSKVVLPSLKHLELVTLPREVIKWIQSLDLTYSVRNVKKDFNNGFLVAQILSRYYPVTEDYNLNFKAIQMHQIDNGFSTEKKKDNWNQIQKFINKIGELNIKIDDMETFIKNENDEVLLFVIKLYQELTKKKIPVIEKKIKTDVDNQNRSFLQKDNGEIELLKKDNEIITEPKVEDMQKSQKTNNNTINTKSTGVVMKGDVKPIIAAPSQIEKTFRPPKISEQKVWEKSTRLIRQVRESTTDPSKLSQAVKKEQEESNMNRFSSLLRDDQEPETKTVQMNNPFTNLDDPLSKRISLDYPNDFEKIKITSKFLVDFFRSASEMSMACLEFVLSYINQIIDEYYNHLSEKQVNEYIDTFLIIYEAYISLDNDEDDNKRFILMHDSLIQFFNKSLRNKKDEMYFIFKNVFIRKMFETMSDREYYGKLPSLCDLIFRILEPSTEQQVELFKMLKENIKDEELIYECFAILHDKLRGTYAENLIDGCLFYILNGIYHENPRIRYFSLYLLQKYCLNNINFFYNFQSKLEKFALKETDRENCLMIIKIACTLLKTANVTKNKSKDIVKKSGLFPNDKNEDETALQNYFNETTIANKIIHQIVTRNTGDHLFILLFSVDIVEFLFDNIDLYKIFLTALFICNDSIHRFLFYDEELDENVKTIYDITVQRTPVALERPKEWNYHWLLKAYDILLYENQSNIQELTEKDYNFIKFILKNGLNPIYSDIWRNHFRFSKYVINDLKNYAKCHRSLGILETFLFCEPIRKQIFDEWYDNLHAVFTSISQDTTENGIKCKETVIAGFNAWIKSSYIGQIIRDDLRKLLAVFPVSNE